MEIGKQTEIQNPNAVEIQIQIYESNVTETHGAKIPNLCYTVYT